MDIANYLSELLGQHGKISVPGLGYFVHVRVSAHYNDAERKFYPPGYKIQFDPESVEGDETLTKYIAEKKKISLASSKYFTDKYITSLKQEAAIQEVSLADMGWFFMDKGKIAFKSKISNTDNALYYGYEAISIKKLNQTAEPEVPVEVPAQVSAPIMPVTIADSVPAPAAEPLPLPAPIREIRVPTPDTQQPEEYIEAEPEQRRGVSIWAIVLIAIIVLAAAGFGVYKYKPEWLHLNKGVEMQLPPEPKAIPVAKPDTDSLKKVVKPADTVKAISKPDSALTKTGNNTPVVNDTLTKVRYELLAGAFKRKIDAENKIADYKKIGLKAHILENVPGRLVKLSLGTYFIRDEAVEQQQKIIATGKLKENSITIQPYNPKK